MFDINECKLDSGNSLEKVRGLSHGKKPDNYEMRRRKIKDLPAILSILRVSFPHWYRRIWYLFCPTIVITVNRTILGFVVAPIHKRVGEIGMIAVSARHRKLGLGCKLLIAALEYLGRKKITYCLAKVRIDNEPAMRLFSKVGFCNVRLLHRPLLGDVYLLKKRL